MNAKKTRKETEKAFLTRSLQLHTPLRKTLHEPGRKKTSLSIAVSFASSQSAGGPVSIASCQSPVGSVSIASCQSPLG